MIIGGKEDKKGDKVILRHFVEMSGGEKSRIGILTTATQYPTETGEEYDELFRSLGCPDTQIFHLDTRESAEEGELKKRLETCTGLFITGGDQVRLTSLLGGTFFYDELRDRWHDGMPIGGTSAGAAVMSCHMIMSALEVEDEYIVEMGVGFCLIEDAIIDQHFSQRARFGRLMTAIAHNPQVMGIGIDENTAIHVQDDGSVFSVLGEHSVTVFDGKKLEYVDTTDHGDNTNITISGVRLHSLASGYRFDLITRKLCSSAPREEDDDDQPQE
ncbi:cyanophycinase [Saccharibacillus sp. O23]|uniref:cyanophycinase n=1 Tax=Saccharibacillus sp. O23 TaxID=2009338 RepID=UPI0015C657A9|nr:cyanophycinase [Saccharibacillus sp. O23]